MNKNRRLCAAVTILCVVMLTLALTGCGGHKADKQEEEKVPAAADPKAVVTAAFDALKKSDFETAQKYMPDLDTDKLKKAGEDEGNMLFMGLMSRALENMEYTIKDVKEDGEQAKVTVEVANLDTASAVEEFYTAMVDAIIEDSNADGELSPEKMDEILNEMTDQLKEEKKFKKATIELTVKNNKFGVTTDQLDKMLGGLLTVGEKMNE